MNRIVTNIIIENKMTYRRKELFNKLLSVGVLGLNLHAYMDQHDYHKEYLIDESYQEEIQKKNYKRIYPLLKQVDTK